MRPVEQTSFFRPETDPRGPSRGNCLAACVASIFEVPITQAAGCAGGTGQELMTWTRENYPALRCEHRMLSDQRSDFDPESWRDWPRVGSVVNAGYWIASVYSFRVPDKLLTGCGCAYDPQTGAERPGDPDCRWCKGRPADRVTGVLWGLHAVVMLDGAIAWDPHPRRAEGVGPIKSQMTWRVVDPALL